MSPFRRFPVLPVALLCVLLAGGCASRRKKARAETPPPVHGDRFEGSITLVNEEARFVLIEGGYRQAPADGTFLKSFREGNESAELRVSPERHRPFVIADIVKGSPQKGDRVTLSKAVVSKAIPATVPPVHSAEAPALDQ